MIILNNCRNVFRKEKKLQVKDSMRRKFRDFVHQIKCTKYTNISVMHKYIKSKNLNSGAVKCWVHNVLQA